MSDIDVVVVDEVSEKENTTHLQQITYDVKKRWWGQQTESTYDEYGAEKMFSICTSSRRTLYVFGFCSEEHSRGADFYQHQNIFGSFFLTDIVIVVVVVVVVVLGF